MNGQEEQLKKQVLAVIAKNLGNVTAELYGNFYKDKELPLVMMSAWELLSEVLGEKRAEAELGPVMRQSDLSGRNNGRLAVNHSTG